MKVQVSKAPPQKYVCVHIFTYLQDVSAGEGEGGRCLRPCDWLSWHLTLVSLEMGTRRQALGRTAISLWHEAAPLERNRTGCDGEIKGGWDGWMDGWRGEERVLGGGEVE